MYIETQERNLNLKQIEKTFLDHSLTNTLHREYEQKLQKNLEKQKQAKELQQNQQFDQCCKNLEHEKKLKQQSFLKDYYIEQMKENAERRSKTKQEKIDFEKNNLTFFDKWGQAPLPHSKNFKVLFLDPAKSPQKTETISDDKFYLPKSFSVCCDSERSHTKPFIRNLEKMPNQFVINRSMTNPRQMTPTSQANHPNSRSKNYF